MSFFKRNGKKIILTIIVFVCILTLSHIFINYLIPFISDMHK